MFKMRFLAMIPMIGFAHSSLAGPTPDPPYWAVTVAIHEIWGLTGEPGGQDFYAKIFSYGLEVNTSPVIWQDHSHIFPDWSLTVWVPVSDAETEIGIIIEVWDEDTVNDQVSLKLPMTFKPLTCTLTIPDIPEWRTGGCAGSLIEYYGCWDDCAIVDFSVTSSFVRSTSGKPLVGAADGDSDSDGLDDCLEICGSPGVDLPAMGADPLRKDLFVELDWMADSSHSHAPWLPALANAWEEFNVAPVSNPRSTMGTEQPGIRLHVDTGTLYESYVVNLHADGEPEIIPNLDMDHSGANESWDMDRNGIPDIGYLQVGPDRLKAGNQIDEGPLLSFLSPDAAGNHFAAGSEFAAIKAANFDNAREGIFRYGLFGHYAAPAASPLPSSCPTIGGCAWGGDFMVLLGGQKRQGYDRNPIDGNSDESGSRLLGPSVLWGGHFYSTPVDGNIEQHTGVFMHELGHTLGLKDGGVLDAPITSVQGCKPNYLSIMNDQFYRGIPFDTDGILGDGLGDRTGKDRNHDGVPDAVRFMYSSEKLDSLDELSLREELGVGSRLQAITTYGPVFSRDGDAFCDLTPGLGHCALPTLANGKIDWNRSGEIDPGTVSTLPSPPYSPPGILLDLNNRAFDPVTRACRGGTDSGAFSLHGFNDYDYLQRSGLRVQELDLDAALAVERNTVRAIRVPDEAFILDRCTSLGRITFDEFPDGTLIDDEYAPAAVFPSDLTRLAVIASGADTTSPPNHLVNLAGPFLTPQSLIVQFGNPQRLVGLYAGRTDGVFSPNYFAVLRAYDVDGFPMGEVRENIAAGISGFLGLGAVFIERPIARIELHYETVPDPPVPIQIDDLILCERIVDGAPPEFPPPPAFGDLELQVDVNAVYLVRENTVGVEHPPLVRMPLVNLPVDVGVVRPTDFSFMIHEGVTATLTAPSAITGADLDPLRDHSNFVFFHWELVDNGIASVIFFPRGQNEISMIVLRDSATTAIYVPDDDFDGVSDTEIADVVDNCIGLSNQDQADADKDRAGDVCDSCRDRYNPLQPDTDFDGLGNECDPDDDGDLVPDALDNCPVVLNADQSDSDGDGIGDVCELAVDYNFDGAIDLFDYRALADCLFGPYAPSCAGAVAGVLSPTDPDADGDTDLYDVAIFQRLFTGEPCPGSFAGADFCPFASPLCDGDTSFSTNGATTDGSADPICLNEKDAQVHADIWYDYTATCSGTLTVTCCDAADFDTRIAIYEGCDCSVFAILGCNDDAPGCSRLTSELSVPVIGGNCYKVRVGGFNGALGTGSVGVHCLE